MKIDSEILKEFSPRADIGIDGKLCISLESSDPNEYRVFVFNFKTHVFNRWELYKKMLPEHLLEIKEK